MIAHYAHQRVLPSLLGILAVLAGSTWAVPCTREGAAVLLDNAVHCCDRLTSLLLTSLSKAANIVIDSGSLDELRSALLLYSPPVLVRVERRAGSPAAAQVSGEASAVCSSCV